MVSTPAHPSWGRRFGWTTSAQGLTLGEATLVAVEARVAEVGGGRSHRSRRRLACLGSCRTPTVLVPPC